MPPMPRCVYAPLIKTVELFLGSNFFMTAKAKIDLELVYLLIEAGYTAPRLSNKFDVCPEAIRNAIREDRPSMLDALLANGKHAQKTMQRMHRGKKWKSSKS